MNMTTDQIKAARALKTALKKCAAANLTLHCFTDVGIYLVDDGAETPDCFDLPSAVQDFYANNAFQVDAGFTINFDAGAGV